VSTLSLGMIATAAAAERVAAVPHATLTAMGYGNVPAMSDDDGLAVRGRGSFAIVWGTGYGPIVRRHFAAGSNVIVSPGGKVSGGRSYAFAR
jgi:hypothetical protein